MKRKKKAWRKKSLLLISYNTEYRLVTQTQNNNHNLGVRSESNLFLMITSNLKLYYLMLFSHLSCSFNSKFTDRILPAQASHHRAKSHMC